MTSTIIQNGPSIAVLGAGFQGVCVSLELAKRGYSVHLYDQDSEVISRTGVKNEGKIHFGFVYANDKSGKTAEKMLTGALHFLPLVCEWLGDQSHFISQSEPFYYAVHKQSLLTEFEIDKHFDLVSRKYTELRKRYASEYLNNTEDVCYKKLSKSDSTDIFCSTKVSASYRTIERSIDTNKLAQGLRWVVANEQRISFFGNTRIMDSKFRQQRIVLDFYTDPSTFKQTYECVINCLWDGRMKIDVSMGLQPPRKWIHRFKVGFTLDGLTADQATVPSTTFILGSFGDTVNYGNGKIYLSWYPSGMLATSKQVLPPNWDPQLTPSRQKEILIESLSRLSELCPSLKRIPRLDELDLKAVAGVITAWGETDISDIKSNLHSRSQIGISSIGNYFSINTGKYTMAPYFAIGVCDQIQKRSR